MKDLESREIREMLFNMQRLQVLTLYSQEEIDESYAFAWSEKIYPYMHTAIDLHKPYTNLFLIKKEEIKSLEDFLNKQIDNNQKVGFWNIEEHFGVKGLPGRHHPEEGWTKEKLIDTCRYLYLAKWHDNDNFWNTLTENDECSTEAKRITRPFEISSSNFL